LYDIKVKSCLKVDNSRVRFNIVLFKLLLDCINSLLVSFRFLRFTLVMSSFSNNVCSLNLDNSNCKSL